MVALLKHLLIFLLVLAVPVQGMAAASTTGCAQGHSQGEMQGPAQTWMPTNPTAPNTAGEGARSIGQASTDHHAHAAHVHAPGTARHTHAPGDSAHNHAAEHAQSADVTEHTTQALPAADQTHGVSVAAIDDAAGSGAASCSACAACCVGAILISKGGFTTAAGTLHSPHFLVRDLAVSFITSGPQRPPRFLLV